MFLNSSNQYPLDKEHRARRMREVESDHLASIAQSGIRARFSGQHGRRLVIGLAMVLVILSALAFAPTSHAQDATNAGKSEPFGTAITAYRVGHFYYVRGDYERAIVKYNEAIAGIPQEAFEASVDYAALYWDLGDAQFKAGQYRDALASYQYFLELAGDEASIYAIARAQQLEAALNNAPTMGVALIGS